MWKLIRKNTNYNGKRDNFFATLDFDPDIADKINDHFSGIATDPDYRLGEVDEIVREGLIHCPAGDDIHVSEMIIFKYLSEIGRTSPGPDNIPHWVYKGCAFELTPVITHIVNLSLRTGKVPAAWKKALVTPVPKVKKVSDYDGVSRFETNLCYPHPLEDSGKNNRQEVFVARPGWPRVWMTNLPSVRLEVPQLLLFTYYTMYIRCLSRVMIMYGALWWILARLLM